MATIFSYIRIFLFLGGTLLGVQVPFFVDQYGNSLESHLIESQKVLNEFQDDADKYFNGSFEKLIAHYKDSDDYVFSDGGESIQSIYDRNLMLKQSSSNFQSSTWSANTQAVINPVSDVKNEVWRNYSYSIKLDPQSIVFGLVAGLLMTVLIEMMLPAVRLFHLDHA